MEEEAGSNDVWTNPDKYLILLQAENKMTRRKTLTIILNEFQKCAADIILQNQSAKVPGPDGDGKEENKNEKDALDEDDITTETEYLKKDQLEIFSQYIRPLITLISDPMEKCRELAYETLTLTAETILNPDNFVLYLPSIVPILLERLGQQELNESSEEVRLLALKFMSTIVTKMDSQLAPFVDDFIQIFSVTLVDPFHSVRKVTCEVTSSMAKNLPQVFHYNSERLIKPLCSTINHQQFRIRVAVVECIGDVIIYGSHKTIADVVPAMIQRLFDPSPNVRKAVVLVVSKWMKEFVDRYSHFQRLIPIILTALNDEAPDVRDLAESQWAEIGNRYLEENVDEYKEQVDFPIPQSKHYPKGVKRPSLGCRVLVWRHVCNIIPGVTNDITDWLDGNRVKSAQLMYYLILNCETKITMHAQPLLQSMFKACLDKNPQVIEFVLKSANLLGYFVPLSTSWPILATALTTSTHEGCLAVSASILQGSDPDSLTAQCQEVFDLISSEDVCQTLNPKRQMWILKICNVFMDEVPGACSKDIGYPLFVTLISIVAMSRDAHIQEEGTRLLRLQQQVSEMIHLDELFVKHCGHILDKIKTTSFEWTPVTPNKLIFATILSQGGAVVENNMNIILDILVENLDPEKDPEVRLKFFTLLSQVLSNYNLSSWADEARIRNMQIFVMNVVENVLSPSLVWKAGKTASALRTAALACLLKVLEGELSDTEVLLPMLPKLVPICVGLIDDHYHLNRLVACQCLGSLALRCPNKMPPELVHNTYIELLKRMDDENGNVRISACMTIAKLFGNVPQDYDVTFFKVHLETVYRGLILYLDDEDENIQKCVYDVLKQIGMLKRDTLIDECKKIQPKLRNKEKCQELIDYFDSKEDNGND